MSADLGTGFVFRAARVYDGFRFSFVTRGRPAPQGSKTRTRYGMRESSVYLKPWREAMIADIHAGMADVLEALPEGAPHPFPFSGALGLTVRFDLTKGKRNARTQATSRPDLDKLVRAVGDALTISGLIDDDSQIVFTISDKSFAGADGPGVSVFVWEVAEGVAKDGEAAR